MVVVEGGKWRKGEWFVCVLGVGRAALPDVKFPLKSEANDSNSEAYVRPSTNGFKWFICELFVEGLAISS